MIRPASEWGRANRAQPPALGRVEHLTVHYTGTKTVKRTADQIPAYIKATERYHLGRDPKMSAIAYNFVIDQFGRIWEARGWVRNAADGNQVVNANSVSVCVLVGVEDKVSETVVAALQSLYAIASARAGRKLSVRCHGDVRATACPGADLRALVRSGRIQQGATVPPVAPPAPAPKPPAPAPKPPAPKPPAPAPAVRWYTVKRGDSYWRIATQRLGTGTRWKEVSDLNGNKGLQPGMKIKLPHK
jgi:LysM repeat protein